MDWETYLALFIVFLVIVVVIYVLVEVYVSDENVLLISPIRKSPLYGKLNITISPTSGSKKGGDIITVGIFKKPESEPGFESEPESELEKESGDFLSSGIPVPITALKVGSQGAHLFFNSQEILYSSDDLGEKLSFRTPKVDNFEDSMSVIWASIYILDANGFLLGMYPNVYQYE